MKNCFIIGPMKDVARLKDLGGFVQSALASFGYQVRTPDQPISGQIMQHVMKSLDRADLLICDISYNNPNVFYELGIYHCLGRPYLIMRERGTPEMQEDLPFDISGYRYLEFTREELTNSDNQNQLKDNLEEAVRQIEVWNQGNSEWWYSNPATEFYHTRCWVTDIANLP